MEQLRLHRSHRRRALREGITPPALVRVISEHLGGSAPQRRKGRGACIPNERLSAELAAVLLLDVKRTTIFRSLAALFRKTLRAMDLAVLLWLFLGTRGCQQIKPEDRSIQATGSRSRSAFSRQRIGDGLVRLTAWGRAGASQTPAIR